MTRILTRMFVVPVIGVPFMLRPVFVGISAMRTAVRIPVAIVVWIIVFRTISTVARVVAHLLPWRRTIIRSPTTVRSGNRTSLRTAEGRSFVVSRHHPRAMKFSRARGSCDHGPTVILGSQESPVVSGFTLVVHLHVSRFVMMFTPPHFLLARWTHLDSPAAAVVADPVHRDVVDDRLVVNGNIGDGDVVHGAVVEEVVVSPIAAFIAAAEVAEAIIHAAIKADVRSPVARVPYVHAVAPSPVSRCPEQAHRRLHRPRTR